MDRHADRQTRVNRSRDELIRRYPSLWQNIITEWKSPGSDQAWLMYSANYLFRTGHVRWALDPLTLHWRLKGAAPQVDVSVLGDASFILLTHRHEDHLDLDLLSALRHSPILWVVPESILSQVIEQTGIPRGQILVPEPFKPLTLNGISITPFDGLHLETEANGAARGVPATGYLVEFNGKRWLFPGDTRTYDVSQLPDLGCIDGLFAHLWMGRGSAPFPSPPLLESFCRFFASLKPDHIVISHLEEFGRAADDFWEISHAERAIQYFQDHASHFSYIHTHGHIVNAAKLGRQQ